MTATGQRLFKLTSRKYFRRSSDSKPKLVGCEQSEYKVRRSRDLEQQKVTVPRFDDRQALLETKSVLKMIFPAVKNPS